MLRVGRISYLNVEPFFHAFPWPLAAALPPRALGEAVARGEIDAGPVALADVLRLSAVLTPLPLGVACPERAQSVLLFSSRPLTDLGGRRIAVTGETATSVRLLRILLAFRYEVEAPVLVDQAEPADAVLLIGDAALRTRAGAWPHPRCVDLGEEWTGWTGLPSLFAVWAARRDAPEGAVRELGQALDRALEEGLRALPIIARRRRDTGLDEDAVVRYLRGFTYRLGPAEEKAAAEFTRLAGMLDG